MPVSIHISQRNKPGSFLKWFREWVLNRYDEAVEEFTTGFKTQRFKVKISGISIAELETKSNYGDIGVFIDWEWVDIQFAILKKPGELVADENIKVEDFAQVFCTALENEAKKQSWGTESQSFDFVSSGIENEGNYSTDELFELRAAVENINPAFNSLRILNLDTFQWFAVWKNNKFLPGLVKALTTPLPSLPEKVIEEEKSVLNVEDSISITGSLRDYNFHPSVLKFAERYFSQGHYRPAILDTYIGLVNAVQDKASRHDLDNSQLMQKVFSAENPILKLSNDKDERLGFMWLFSGAVMAIRNTRAHKIPDDSDKQKTLETLALASKLFRLLDEAEVVKQGPSISSSTSI